MLSQMQDSQERVTAYYSKTLNKAERNYCITLGELLAIVIGTFPQVSVRRKVRPAN
jgi:hypothetical protein